MFLNQLYIRTIDQKCLLCLNIVIRRSDFVCPRTLAVVSDRASDSLPRGMVEALRDPKTAGSLVIEVA